MNSKIFLIATIIYSVQANAQTLKYNYGQIFYNSKTITPVLNQYEEYTNRNFTLFRYQHSLRDGWKAILAYSYFEGWTDFSIDRPYFANLGASWGGNGASYLKIKRFGLGAGFDFIKKEWLYCMPTLMLNLQKSRPTNIPEISDIIDSRTDPDFAGVIYNTPYSTTQIVPELGFDVGVLILRRVEIGLNMSYALGHKSYQDMAFEYTYKGAQQPTAKWYADGTAWFATLGLGFKFW